MIPRDKAKLYYPDNFRSELDLNKIGNKKSDKFKTHDSKAFAFLHEVIKKTLRPGRATLEFFSEVVEPMPGQCKDIKWAAIAKRCSALVLGILLAPIGLASGIVGKSMELLSHTKRSFISVIDNSNDPDVEQPKPFPKLTQEDPLHIRTHNLGFVINSMSTVGDLRRPKIRAQEVVDSIMSDKQSPDVIFFQEGFNEGATRTLCEGIKKKYPHIAYNIAPHISGFNSGQMVASKYPIDKIEYDRLEGMLSPETMSARGIVTTTFQTDPPIKVYAVHTQPLLGHDRAQVRMQQMKQIQKKMADDLEKDPTIRQVLVGDFNTSRLNAWGEDNIEPRQQAETPVLDYIGENFADPYYNDHDLQTGVRTVGNPMFLEHDNERMGQADLKEPSGSWYVGPFNDKGLVMKTKLRIDRAVHHHKKGAKVIENPKKAKWGTSNWEKEQPANTARFDFVLFPKNSNLTANVETRRIVTPKGKQSAPTDHLPVDAKVYVRPSRQEFLGDEAGSEDDALKI